MIREDQQALAAGCFTEWSKSDPGTTKAGLKVPGHGAKQISSRVSGAGDGHDYDRFTIAARFLFESLRIRP
jgi:hypothetical protein